MEHVVLLPDTKVSLILRLPRSEDAAAWREFVDIYEPFILRMARRRGLQEADARDLVQRVMLAVTNAIDRWNPDPERGKFRGWLFKIARNQLVNILSGVKPDRAAGGSTQVWALQQHADPRQVINRVELDFEREVFRYAATRVKQNVQASTWDAFWSVAIQEESPAIVAQRLGMSVGAVYIARSRVLGRLREEVRRLEADDA